MQWLSLKSDLVVFIKHTVAVWFMGWLWTRASFMTTYCVLGLWLMSCDINLISDLWTHLPVRCNTDALVAMLMGRLLRGPGCECDRRVVWPLDCWKCGLLVQADPHLRVGSWHNQLHIVITLNFNKLHYKVKTSSQPLERSFISSSCWEREWTLTSSASRDLHALEEASQLDFFSRYR